ncbi:phage tail protein, partial [Brachyspira murdochii]
KFKIEIPETINLVLADADNTAEYQAAIIKQADGSYVLNASIENYTLTSHSQSIFFIIKSIDSNINVYQIYSILSQFFSFNSIYNLELNECRISNIEYELKSTIGFITESYTVIAISKQDLTNFNQGSYNITLNIKNRVLRNEDRNIFASSFAFMSSQSVLDCYNFTLEQDNNNVKLKGEYTLKEGAGVVIGFYSPIIENYFNVSSGAVNIQNTTGITSSNGNPMKFGIYKSSNDEVYRGIPPYILFVGYQDDSTIQVGDTITFNLTPDKNST